MRWHFHFSLPADGATNMALDEALQRRVARAGGQEAVFRVYGWSSPTLSLGRNQRARGCYDVAGARARGIGIVRRPTGGRALLHHREVTYSATLPVSDAAAARAAYDFINGVLVAGLRRLGVAATRATGTMSLPPGLRPCFDVPAEHEIALAGRKLVGSAQWRHDGALLQHGSILVRDDQGLIATLVTAPGGTDTPAAATLGEALGRDPAPAEVAEVLRGALDDATGAPCADFSPDSGVERDVERLRASYESESWTWRR